MRINLSYMIRFILTAIIVFFVSVICSAQGEDNSLKGVPFGERIVTGGGFGLGFNSYQDYVMLSPSVGYMVTKKFIAGIGITYRYTKSKIYQPAVTFNDYGINPFLRYFVYRNIFVQTEYEYLNYEFLAGSERFRKGFKSFFAGGGFSQPIGGKVSFYLMALYNFSYTTPLSGQYVPYSSPLIIRAGINIGNFLSF